MFLNTGTFIGISLFTERKSQEIYQAEMFVEAFKHSVISSEGSVIWKGTAYIPDLKTLMSNFIGEERAIQLLQNYAKRRNISWNESGKAEPAMVNFAERILAGSIGSASARIMVKSVVKEEDLSIDEVLNILRESQLMKETNKELRRKSAELSKATEELKRANEQLKQMDEMKDECLYTVTHELRTPLTSVRALSEIVHDNPDLPEEQKSEYLSAIMKETIRLSHLITQVLNLERYESGRTKLNYSNIDFASLLKDTINSANPLLKEKKLQLVQQISEELPVISGDKDLLNQVFYNLTSNAIKYAKNSIIIKALGNHLQLRISVKDDGPGIAGEVHELIFDKFFQAKNQTLKKPEGSGLGLAICKRIVEMHHGKIWVESEEGNGSEFIVELPVETI